MKILFLKYYLFVLLLLPLSLYTQSPTAAYLSEEVSPTNFDKEAWKSITKGMEFDTKKREEREPREKKESSPSFFMGEGWSLFAKFLLIMFFVIIIGLLIKNVIVNKNQTIDNKKLASDEEVLAEIEDNIHDSDIGSFIEKALAEGNYTLATRLRYLNILKALSTQNIIKWKKDKTNRTYLFEIKNKKLKDDFRELTTIFERVWYGEIALQKSDYDAISPIFNLFFNEIKKVR